MTRPFSVAELITIRDVMADAAREASALISADFNANASAGVHYLDYKPSQNGRPDFVTKTDIASEKLIKEKLAEFDHTIPFHGEECGGSFDHPIFWLVDPLDGTRNFRAMDECFGLSIALIKDGKAVAGVLADPMRDIIIKGAIGSGAYREYHNNHHEKLQCTLSPNEELSHVFFNCCIPYDDKGRIKEIEIMHPHVLLAPKSGSTVHDIIHMLRGKKTVCASSELMPWDIAAATCLLPEAGFAATQLDGKPLHYQSTTILTGAPKHHEKVLKILTQQPA